MARKRPDLNSLTLLLLALLIALYFAALSLSPK